MRWTAALVIALALPARADGLPEGAYRVETHIALPNIDTRDYDFTAEICWRGVDDPEMPLGPLGPGPLADCPTTARETGTGLLVTAACPGGNAGTAAAIYHRTEAGFLGRVQMNMGGKNMTVGEIQRGTRIGPCE